MTNTKFKTITDLQKALEAFGMDPESLKEALEMVSKSIGTKYMTELYATVPHDVIDLIQTMSKDGATQAVHQAYFEKTGVQAMDRLDEIISVTIEDMIERPGDYFQKKTN